MPNVIEFDQKCKACKGTGVYVGMAERNGFAVQCYVCNGEGHHQVRIEYEDFEGLEIREGVERVVERNPGIILAGADLEQFGGIPYQDWLDGKGFPPGTEMRGFTCPAWYFMKGAIWGRCHNSVGSRYADCAHFNEKETCWQLWDEEVANAKR